MIIPFQSKTPMLGNDTFVAPDAWIIGDVTLGECVSVFFHAVLRGDLLPIRVGARTNIQEHAMLHTTSGRSPTIVGSQVTVGHRAIIHGATVGDRCLIGMGSIILDDTVIEDDCIIGAGAVVPEGKRIPARSLVMGVPGKVVRTLSDEEVAKLPASAEAYVQTAKALRENL
ncbi:MAG: gamma carbonic anhydrase family protein [Bdellovibrionales bacterium]|nr:gamma carbonic anhydrase family protein [Bdellovibrionales bacterium]